jgi:3-hydroxy-3-methylglutaryl CoA synthase
MAIGKEKVIANLIGSHSIVDEMTDVWRREDDRSLRDGRSVSRSPRVINAWCARRYQNCSSALLLDLPRFQRRFSTRPIRETLASTAKSLGLKPEQIPDHLFSSVGNSGTAMPILVLSSVLEVSKPGEKLLVIGYGSGCDGLLFEVTG